MKAYVSRGRLIKSSKKEEGYGLIWGAGFGFHCQEFDVGWGDGDGFGTTFAVAAGYGKGFTYFSIFMELT